MLITFPLVITTAFASCLSFFHSYNRFSVGACPMCDSRRLLFKEEVRICVKLNQSRINQAMLRRSTQVISENVTEHFSILRVLHASLSLSVRRSDRSSPACESVENEVQGGSTLLASCQDTKRDPIRISFPTWPCE